jgi:predicted nucleic acid-binding protein
VSVYFDSSALVAVYVTEPFSKVARREAVAASQVPYTALHALEVPNALRVLHGRELISARELRDLLAQLQSDVDAHRLVATRVDLFALFDRASELSKAHAARLLVRSLDTLHVAAALELHCRQLVSGDARQLALASASGLEAIDVKKGRRRGVGKSRRH